ncbi:phage tail assembly protein [Ewingella sp. S1.OA.A_B6]
MEEQNKTITIPLDKPLTDASGKLSWEAVELHEPALIEVSQFFDEQKKNGALSAAGLLISLLSGIPTTAVKRLPFSSFKQCEAFILTFLNFKPEESDPSAVPASATSIMLSRQLEDNNGKQAWVSVDLCEPYLEQVDQFYKTQTAKGGLTAMATLVSELAGIPLPVINRLSFTDYKRCETYLLVFLNYSPTAADGVTA